MYEVTSTGAAAPASLPAMRVSFLAAGAAVVLLAALHVLSPEFDPSWRMVSEYALGAYGWLLTLMFLAWAVGSVALFAGIRPQVQTTAGKIGLLFLLLAALGTTLAAIFDVRTGLHGLATLIGMPGMVLAPLLISVSLLRNPRWTPVRQPLLWTAHLTWIGFVLMFAALFAGLSLTGGQFGPEVLIGWPNRLMVVAYCAWLMLTARHAIGKR